MATSKLQAENPPRSRGCREVLAQVGHHFSRCRSLHTRLQPASRYCDHMNEDYEATLLSDDPAVYMNFFDWMWKSSREKRLQSYDEYWRRLCQSFFLFARRSVNQFVREQVRRVGVSFPLMTDLCCQKPIEQKLNQCTSSWTRCSQPSARSTDE